MFMYILSVEGYGEIHPTRPCSHDFMAKPSLYTLPQDTIHDVGAEGLQPEAQGQPKEPSETKKSDPPKGSNFMM